ncbi:hypothetical protein BKH43_04410 [Helicobacter sp. 13S00401-1]|uniref:alpha-1,2-fucosyltransferase n=1 Tax=Helicobacter sp. 13S00401-1 TaxID=1905758 RepID=UPI000BA63BE2|nr:alpha-1,2-fucosyltransferase [Helicobacter sp. 13S00401-1]PAF50342.1 hypothetical protein BKH43_04410 [Helicobacter sp. 13S00401-1]
MKNKVQIKMQGRLGNQFFIYAFAKSLLHKLQSSDNLDIKKTKVILLCDEYENLASADIFKYNIDLSLFDLKFYGSRISSSNFFLRATRKAIYLSTGTVIRIGIKDTAKKKSFYIQLPILTETYTQGEFDENVIKDCLNKCLLGYFQSELYFEDIKESLKKDFVLKAPLKSKTQKALTKIRQDSKAIFVHIRRGDYLAPANITLYASLGANYYKSAIKLALEKIPDAKFYIFSDDIAWVKEEGKSLLGFEGLECEFMDLHGENEGYLDLELMRACKGAITANSSFSWWGAYLIEEPKVVIAPFPFHFIHSNVDLLLDSWIVLDYKSGDVLKKEDYLYETLKTKNKQESNSKSTSSYFRFHNSSGGGGGNTFRYGQ